MAKATVAILRTKPETVVEDYRRLCELAGLRKALDPSATTILKDNITWHNVFPGVNTTPWQLEGTIEALKYYGFTDLVTVHNHTVVTIPEKGEEDLKFKPIYGKYNIPVRFNFKEEHMRWVEYRPKFKTLALHKIFPDGIRIPDYFHGKKHRAHAHRQNPFIHHLYRRAEKCLRRPAQLSSALHPYLDS